MSDPVMISIYVPDGDDLPAWLLEFELWGFYEADYCQLVPLGARSDQGALGEVPEITYGPCAHKPKGVPRVRPNP